MSADGTRPDIPGVARYRVREPVTVEAIRYTGDNDAAVTAFAGPDWTCIPPGCYVVKGITGHFFTVDAAGFAATYEPESLSVPVDEWPAFRATAPDPLVMPADELAAVRQLAAAARAADAAYKLAAARVVLYEFLHQYGRSELPAFKVALDLASSLRKIIDGLAETDAGVPAVTSPAPAPDAGSGTATGPAEGDWRERAEQAEAKLAEVRSVLLEGGQGDATARRRAIAIVGIKGGEHE